MLVRQNFNQTLVAPTNSTFTFEFGNFCGDGETYLLKKETISNSSGAMYLYQINLTTNSLTLITPTSPTFSEKLNYTRTTDVNGNGIPDLFLPQSSSFWEYKSGINSFVDLNFPVNFNSIQHEPEYADFNADGKTDVLIYNLSTKTWSLKISTGNSFANHTCPLLRSRTKDNLNDENYNDFYYISDFNGDNLNDIIEIYPENNHYKVNVYYFNGSSFITGDYGYITSNKFYRNRLMPYYDINADGNCDLVEFNAAGSTIAYKSFTTSESQRRLSSIINGLNQKNTISYKNLSDNNIYTQDSTFLTQDVISPCLTLPVVSETIFETEEESSFETDYLYKGLRLHTKGKGMLGFEEFVEDNISQNRKTTSKFGFNTTYFNTYPTQQILSTSSGSAVSTTTLTNNVTSLGGKRIFPYVSSQTTTDHLTGLAVITQTSNFDGYGNPQTIIRTKGGLVETL